MTEAISLGFYQRRSLPSPCALDGLADHFIDCNGILSIDRDARDIVGLGALRDIVHRDGFFYRDGDGIAIVFTEINDGQFPDGGKVESFVNGPFIGGTIAEKTQAD